MFDTIFDPPKLLPTFSTPDVEDHWFNDTVGGSVDLQYNGHIDPNSMITYIDASSKMSEQLHDRINVYYLHTKIRG